MPRELSVFRQMIDGPDIEVQVFCRLMRYHDLLHKNYSVQEILFRLEICIHILCNNLTIKS